MDNLNLADKIPVELYPNIGSNLSKIDFMNLLEVLSHKKNIDFSVFTDKRVWRNIEFSKYDLSRLYLIENKIRVHSKYSYFSFPISEINVSGFQAKSKVWWDRFVEHISPDLLSLNLNGANFEFVHLETILKRCRYLNILKIEGCTALSGESYAAITQQLPESLGILHMGRNYHADNGIKYLNQYLNLKCLNFSGLILNSDQRWLNLLENLPLQLEQLDLSYSNYSGSNSVSLSDLDSLKVLVLGNCNNISPDAYSEIIANLPMSIEELYFPNTNGLLREDNYNSNKVLCFSGRGVEGLNRLENLKVLNLYNCQFENGLNWNNLMLNLPDFIQILDLSSSNYVGQRIEELGRLKKLKKLSMKDCEIRRASDWELLIHSLPDTVMVLHVSALPDRFVFLIKQSNPVLNIINTP